MDTKNFLHVPKYSGRNNIRTFKFIKLIKLVKFNQRQIWKISYDQLIFLVMNKTSRSYITLPTDMYTK